MASERRARDGAAQACRLESSVCSQVTASSSVASSGAAAGGWRGDGSPAPEVRQGMSRLAVRAVWR